MLWKTKKGAHFTTEYINENKKTQVDKLLLVSPKVGLGRNCLILNIYNVIPLVKRIKDTTSYLTFFPQRQYPYHIGFMNSCTVCAITR